MKMPQTPPSLESLIEKVGREDVLRHVLLMYTARKSDRAYLHWDEIRRRTPPEGLTHEEWWLGLKLTRMERREIGLRDKNNRPFTFALHDLIQERLHEIDSGAAGRIAAPDSITNPETRDRYIVSSLMEEAITSSQLEGAATTREVAKEMIRTGRKPRERSERMILNNYRTMERIREIKDQPLTPELVFEIHRLVTEDTLDKPDCAGRFRLESEKVVVDDNEGQVIHDPPSANELPSRMQRMCAFANGEEPDHFIHPVVRAIILHFWLAYDHPFVDGNGRTARALFYWAMLHRGYWLFEFLSISSILLKAPIQYGRSFLYTETDDNDLRYFVIAQTKVISLAIKQLYSYLDRKTKEVRETEQRLRALDFLNHRQEALLIHALKHPGHRYTIKSHQTSHQVVYQTARTDLLELHEKGLLDMCKRGKQLVFTAPADLAKRIERHKHDGITGG